MRWTRGRTVVPGLSGLLAAGILLAAGLSPAAAAGSGSPAVSSRVRAKVSPATAAGRYVVLGDSVAYGHGLANPGRSPPRRAAIRSGTVDTGVAEPGRGGVAGAGAPRPAPDRLRAHPPGRPLRPALDQRGARGRRPVGPGRRRLPAAEGPGRSTPGGRLRRGRRRRLAADPPALVTIQAGADDLDFAGCLKALLGVPAALGGDRCVTDGRAGPQLTTRATAELGEVGRGLRAAVDAVHAAPSHAQILLVDYYEPIPAPTAAVRGTSAVCRDLRLRTHLGSWRTVTRSEADLVQQQLDATVRSVAAAYPDVRLVDIARLFSGHELCTTDSWVLDATWNAAHPTAVGQQQIAEAVLATCAQLPRRCLGR